MSLRALPTRVRAHLFGFWAGMVVAGLGIVGFFLSYGEVASPAQAAVAVHKDIPIHAYASIFAWVGGMIVMRVSRTGLDAAVKAKKRESTAPSDTPTIDAPDGRET